MKTICFMYASLDGRIDCAMTEKIDTDADSYYEHLASFGDFTQINGKTTNAMHYAADGIFEVRNGKACGETFYKAQSAPGYQVCMDTLGTLLWDSNRVDGKPLIVVTSEKANSEYLEYLKLKEISYIACGAEKIDLKKTLAVLEAEFGVKKAVLTGGGHINGSFLDAGLIDEVEMMFGPGIDGREGLAASFDGRPQDRNPVMLSLQSAKTFEDSTVLLKYRVKKQSMSHFLTAKFKKRILDFAMMALSLLLMGGPMAFEHPGVHGWMGVSLFVLWICHNILNRNFYKSLFRGKYAAARIIMTSVNLALAACIVLLAVSGIELAPIGTEHSPFDFLGMAFVRKAHLVASHWYFILIALHFSLHAGMIFGNLRLTKSEIHPTASKILRAIPPLLSAYGIYAFICRGIYKYLFYTQPFFFFDVERGFFLFVLDYFSIFTLVATTFHYALKFSIRKKA